MLNRWTKLQSGKYAEGMSKRIRMACALSIAGSDSGGGAGLEADIKSFASLGVHGTVAVTSVTAQNPKTVAGIFPVKPEMVRRQIEAVFAAFKPAACKTGMLYSSEIIQVVARFFDGKTRVPLVVDPVMVSSSGASLLKAAAVRVLRTRLLPLARLVTPNVPEAERLAGFPIREPEEMRRAARRIHDLYGCAVLVKGGHLATGRECVDIFWNGREELMLSAPRIRRVATHGTGCTYSAAITACLARGCSLVQAVERGKEFITQAIARSCRVGRHDVLNWTGQASDQ
jgi:hydroxymethylpyrimidine kinase/phosphomethylpyrimidine kinase